MARREEIKGIGLEYAKKLNSVGIKTTDDDLFNVGRTRKELAEKQTSQTSSSSNG